VGGIRTKPLELGAPLFAADYPHGVLGGQPSADEVERELIRARVELMHAIARHRKAWAKMRRHSEEAAKRSLWAESYPPFKEAVSDVRWWREEMAAQAATVTALEMTLRSKSRGTP
jgi:hypothetical protein